MALDPATTAFVARAVASGRKRLHELTPARAREQSEKGASALDRGPEVDSVSEVFADDVLLRIYRPAEPTGVVVYFHGGGWVVGSLDGYDAVCRTLAHRSGYCVVSVDYRLAPENPFPAAVDDAWSATTWVNEHRTELACAGAPLVVAGDSAGGNLAAVVAQRAARSGPTIALQVLIYPVTDADFDRPSYLSEDNQVLLDRTSMMWCWDHYLPDPAERISPDAAPLRRPDLAGVPPALVLLAEHDVLRDEGHAYVDKLREQRVPADEIVVDGQTHGFFQFPGLLPGAAVGMDHVVAAISRVRTRDSRPERPRHRSPDTSRHHRRRA